MLGQPLGLDPPADEKIPSMIVDLFKFSLAHFQTRINQKRTIN